MAESPYNGPVLIPDPNPEAGDQGRSDRQGLDRAILSNQSASQPGDQGQGDKDNGRISSRGGDPPPSSGGNEGARGLPASSGEAQPDNPFHNAKNGNILQVLADRFNIARAVGKLGAWRQLQTDLMNAMPYLVPVIIPLKDLLNLVADIEKEIKGSTVQAGKSNEELLREYLSGSQELLTDQTVQDSIDTHDTMQVEETAHATSDTDGTQGVS